MPVKSLLRRFVTGGVVASALTAALVGASAAPASASHVPVGYASLCNGASYDAFLKFTNRGISTVLVGPGECLKVRASGSGTIEPVTAVGTGTSGSFVKTVNVKIAWVNFGTSGVGFTVKGTIDNPTATVW